jgi:hypothetical protein
MEHLSNDNRFTSDSIEPFWSEEVDDEHSDDDDNEDRDINNKQSDVEDIMIVTDSTDEIKTTRQTLEKDIETNSPDPEISSQAPG